jgi:hypothetical protein
MPVTAPLETVLADAREEAQTLRRNRAAFSVDRVEAILADVATAAEEWLLWLSETNAAIQCGYSSAWLRARFPAWEREGHARLAGRGVRQYRACVIPHRANVETAAARGQAAARALKEQMKASA